jgi:serine/threonine protein kinase
MLRGVRVHESQLAYVTRVTTPEGQHLAFKRPRATPEARLSIAREGANLTELRGRHIVRLVRVVDEGLLLEWVRGVPLARWVHSYHERGVLPDPAHVMCILHQLAEALETVHAAGLCHGDLALENVMLEAGTGRVVLLDFGEARSAVGAGVLRPVGRHRYAAPERYDGAMSMATDVYALAVMAWELFAGARLGSESERARQCAPSLATVDALRALWDAPLQRAMSKEPESRPDLGAWMRELTSVADEVLGSASMARPEDVGHAVEADVLERAASFGSAPPSNEAPAHEGSVVIRATPHPASRRRGVWALGFFAGLIVFSGLAIVGGRALWGTPAGSGKGATLRSTTMRVSDHAPRATQASTQADGDTRAASRAGASSAPQRALATAAPAPTAPAPTAPAPLSTVGAWPPPTPPRNPYGRAR